MKIIRYPTLKADKQIFIYILINTMNLSQKLKATLTNH